MKISKCKKELARIISKHGGWCDGEFAAQDGDGLVGGYGSKPEWNSLSKYWWREAFGGWFLANKIKNHHQTVLSRTEYFHLYPAPDADGWIEWKGGECPVEKGTLVDVIWRDGTERAGVKALHIGGAGYKFWVADGMANDIIAYRLHKPEVKPEFCESVMRSIPEPESHEKLSPEAIKDAKFALMSESIEESKRKPTIEQLADDYRNAKDYAYRKQEEADAAKADADAKLADLVAAGKALGLALSVADPEPGLVITDWRDLRVGDDVEIVESCSEGRVGHIGVITRFSETDEKFRVRVHFNGNEQDYEWISKWRFIRRP